MIIQTSPAIPATSVRRKKWAKKSLCLTERDLMWLFSTSIHFMTLKENYAHSVNSFFLFVASAFITPYLRMQADLLRRFHFLLVLSEHGHSRCGPDWAERWICGRTEVFWVLMGNLSPSHLHNSLADMPVHHAWECRGLWHKNWV